jgi:hypothetical protein
MHFLLLALGATSALAQTVTRIDHNNARIRYDPAEAWLPSDSAFIPERVRQHVANASSRVTISNGAVASLDFQGASRPSWNIL